MKSYIIVPLDTGRNIAIFINTINYIESQGSKCTVHLNNRSVILDVTMDKVLKMIQGE